MKEYLYRRKCKKESGRREVPRIWRRLRNDRRHNDTLTRHHCSDEIKDDEMGGAVARMGRESSMDGES